MKPSTIGAFSEAKGSVQVYVNEEGSLKAGSHVVFEKTRCWGMDQAENLTEIAEIEGNLLRCNDARMSFQYRTLRRRSSAIERLGPTTPLAVCITPE